MKTFVPKKDDIEKKWWVVNAEGKILGRLATEVVVLLRGKNKPQFAPFLESLTATLPVRLTRAADGAVLIEPRAR